MSKKFYLLTIIGTLVIAAIIVSIFVYYENKNQQTVANKSTGQNGQGEYLTLPIGEIAKKPNLEIPTEKEKVNINNVYKNPVEKLSQNGVAFKENSDYYMAFYPEDNGFLIVINSSDVISAEKRAEDDFLKQLGITKDQACELKISVTVPVSVSETYGGGTYGLSFCPGGNPLK
jgi:ABC-type antimicrobial peptide transport system permease subunit